MGHQILGVIASIFIIQINVANSQSIPSVDWQFDPFSTDQWFKQKLDHYDSGNIQHWPQRYVTSYRFYRLGGPIFLFLSGPGPELTLTDIETGAIAAYAEEQGAFVIGLEHRFYGKSRPTTDLSTENLNFLTIPQTVEDIASFVRTWRARDEFRNSKWAVFGASYLGSLAAWFAQKHPELIDAFVASSAPLELRYEIPEFLENVGQILNETNPKCYDTVAEGFSCLSKIFNEEDCQNYTLADIKDKFEFCSDLDRTRPLDATGVFAELFSTINAVVMYHDPSPDSFPDTNLDRFCKHITVDIDGKVALDKIGERVKEINKHRGVPCAEFRFQTTVDFLQEKEWDSPAAKEGYRQLQWQLCNELGWTVASANISQPFGNYLTPFLHSEICQNLFGLTETEMRLKVLKANTDLKGKNLNTKCGIFVNGDKDPWSTFGITTPEEAGVCNRAIMIKGGSHGRDIEDFSNGPSYPPEVQQAQLKIGHYLDNWLKTGSCCDADASESKRVIATLSRPARASKDDNNVFSNLFKGPNVNIRPHSYPVYQREALRLSPTSTPYQVSTTDVLSVSPRIPVARKISSMGNQERTRIVENIYRDPRNSEFRQYRVVKLLRHRPSFSPPTHQPSMAPSMEQFEADFPEHSIRVEGRVERVFKNGTLIPSTDSPSTEISEQLNLFDKGRRLLQQEVESNEVTAETAPENGSDDVAGNKNRFRFVVKQVFKDVVDVDSTNSSTKLPPELSKESKDSGSRKNGELSQSSKKSAKRQQSLENVDIKNLQQQYQNYNDELANSNSSHESLSTSSSEQQVSSEDPLTGKSSKEIESDVQKRESEEISGSYESSEDDSISASESIEHQSSAGRKMDGTSGSKKSEDTPKNKEKEKKQLDKNLSTGQKKNETEEDDYDDNYTDEYYDDDDDEYYDDFDSKEDNNHTLSRNRNSTNSKHVSSKTNTKGKGRTQPTAKALESPEANLSKEANFSSEFSSGEDTMPKRLREKISQKIMSSSETVEGDQKSKEKTKSNKNGRKENKENKSKSLNGSGESFENAKSSQELFSSEEYNYSLEPSGSNPSKTYRKKQLALITKPFVEQPSTVINVEISGSYPKKSSRRRKSKKTRNEQNTRWMHQSNSSEESHDKSEDRKSIKKIHIRKRISSEGRRNNSTLTPRKTHMKSIVTTTTTSTTTVSPVEAFANPNEPPPTNSYATWNKGKVMDEINAIPVQQEPPAIVSLGEGTSASPVDKFDAAAINNNNNNNEMVYIIIGDIPTEDNPNIINDNPTNEALFNFIQKLVNRHSPGVFIPKQQQSFNFPTPPPTTTTTTTVSPPVISREGFGYAGRYLLVRPVQVVSLGNDRVVHADHLKNDSFIDLMSMETPLHPYPYSFQGQSLKRQNSDPVGGYRFKSPLHRDHFEKLLSVDGQIRDSDRDTGSFRYNFRRLDQIPDPSWRSIRGVSQFGPVAPSQKSNVASGLLSLSAADTMWVNEGVPFLPRNRQASSRNHLHRVNEK